MNAESDRVIDRLFANMPLVSDGKYPDFMLEQYKLYAHSHEIISERREGMNKFFVTLNSAIVAAIGFIPKYDTFSTPIDLIFPVAALLICVFWFLVIRAYDQLNTGKFQVLHAIERRLPLALYEAEWIALGEGKDRSHYTPISRLERFVPAIFGVMYLVLAGHAAMEGAHRTAPPPVAHAEQKPPAHP